MSVVLSNSLDPTFKPCSFLCQHYEQIVAIEDEMTRSRSCDAWWLCAFALTDMIAQIDLCFKNVQYKTVTSQEQYRALSELAYSFQVNYGDDVTGTAPKVSSEKIERHIKCASVDSLRLYDSLAKSVQAALEAGISTAVAGFIRDVTAHMVESAFSVLR
jgi:hypothetical protein